MHLPSSKASYRYYLRGLEQPLVGVKTFHKMRYKGNHLVWTAGNGDPMHEACILHRIHRAKETARVRQEEEADTRIKRRENLKK